MTTYRSKKIMNAAQTFQLISLLEERPHLWQKSHHDFLNKTLRYKSFADIAEKLGTSDEVCKKRTKNLKDRMRGIVWKLPRTENGLPDFEHGARNVFWPYFGALLFMKDEFNVKGDDQENGDADAHQAKARETYMVNSVKDEASASDSDDAIQLPPFASFGAVESHQDASSSARSVSKRARLVEPPNDLKRAHSPEVAEIDSYRPCVDGVASPADEWDAFCSSIACDLRKLKDPFLIMQTKMNVNKVVSEAVMQQLEQDFHSSSNQGQVIP